MLRSRICRVSGRTALPRWGERDWKVMTGFIFLVAYLCLLSWLAKGVELNQLLAPPVTSPEVDCWGCSASKYWLAFFFFFSNCCFTCSPGLFWLPPPDTDSTALSGTPCLFSRRNGRVNHFWLARMSGLAGRWGALCSLDINLSAKMR